VEGEGIESLAKILLGEGYTVSVAYGDGRNSITVQVSRPDDFFNRLPELIQQSGCAVRTMYSLDDNLEAIFRYLVGR
ncbi:MAG: hypothetical protein IH630_06720, partial [Thermoplasmata archaeon]|nr:hypothetical protein [Thermoplasmata archaeon]